MFRIIGYFLGTALMLGFFLAAGGAFYLMSLVKELPDYEVLSTYEPPVTTRIYAGDGSLLGEFAWEKRLYLPIEAIPWRVKAAFLSAEDKNFYTHPGIDVYSLFRAILVNVRNIGSGRRPMGASTITQQVAKNFLLTSDQTIERKIKELLLSFRIEQAYSKDRILELYMNEIFFGLGAYGLASAALVYFNKSVDDLTIAEAAYLAALPKAPANYHPFRHPDRALVRRDSIIELMLENKYITLAESEKAISQKLNVIPVSQDIRLFSAEYFTEEVRKEIIARYGEKNLYERGLSVRTTLNPDMQIIARSAMRRAMINYDTARGYRGPKTNIDVSGEWGKILGEISSTDNIPEWRLAVVISASPASLSVGLQPPRLPSGQLSANYEKGIIHLKDIKWALNHNLNGKRLRASSLTDVFKAGDVIYVEKKEGSPGLYILRQFPQISGGMVVMDPHTGRVLAMVGGFSYSESKFNRATQAMRQPGSAFKPVVYAAALDNGYTPASVVMDGPIVIQIGDKVWSPKNYDRKFAGPSTLRSGIERSRNLMTVRLSHHMGMSTVAEYAERFGLYEKLPPHIAMSLGAGETTVMRMVTAYAIMANGGLHITPSLVDRIQNRYGKTIFKQDQRTCTGCMVSEWKNQPEPELVEHAEQVLDPMTAYQITSMMIGVTQRGTAASLRDLGRPLAGKTGTTNNERDAWFIGYTPDLVVGLYLGFDKPSSLGSKVTGGSLAVPVFKEFMKKVLKDTKPIDFHIPQGMRLLPINRKTGMHSLPGDPDTIVEAFRPGTGPADSHWIIGGEEEEGIEAPEILSPQATQAINEGLDGGLY